MDTVNEFEENEFLLILEIALQGKVHQFHHHHVVARNRPADSVQLYQVTIAKRSWKKIINAIIGVILIINIVDYY